MLTPLHLHVCDALSVSFFLDDDSACTGNLSRRVDSVVNVSTYQPYSITIGPLLTGYCYGSVYIFSSSYSIPSLVAYCDMDGTAHIITHHDKHCTKPHQYATGAEGTCLELRSNHTYQSIDENRYNIRINCTHSLSTRPTNPSRYVNVSAIYYDSSPTCNLNDSSSLSSSSSSSSSSSPSPPYHVPASLNQGCATVSGFVGSFKIICYKSITEMYIWSDQKCSGYSTIVGTIDESLENTTCTNDKYFRPINSTGRNISAYIDCGTAPYNGQPIQYPHHNRTYIVTGVNYEHDFIVDRCRDFSSSYQESFGPFDAGTCQVFASNMSSYMVTCSDDGQARMNVFYGTTTCDTKQFFSFAQGQADGKTCLSFSMSNGDEMFQAQSTTILCKPWAPSPSSSPSPSPSPQPTNNSSPSLYHHMHTYMVLLCLLVICINACASI